MLCPFCQAIVPDNSIVCPTCGKLLPRAEGVSEGVEAIRQGRRAREAAAGREEKKLSPKQEAVSDHRQGQPLQREGRQGMSVDDTEPSETIYAEGVPFSSSRSGYERESYSDIVPDRRPIPHRPRKVSGGYTVSKHMINWTHMTIVFVVIAVLLLIGGMLFLSRTSSGQRIMARMGQDATATAMWEVGEEQLDIGNIEEAIDLFLKAREKDGEEDVNVSGLLLLGTAYEAAGMLEEAEALYTEIYTDIVPSASDAYANAIRILLAQGRSDEAANLMSLAYEMTGNNSFRTQRNALLPSAPSVNMTAGTYDHAITLTLASPDNFSIYYTFDAEAILPDEGTLYTESIYADEGSWKLRAVCVNEQLVSDELTGSYLIVMPSPGTPTCNLAPATYSSRRSVQLRKNAEDAGDDSVIIYYTIDGSIPTKDSPVYDGTPISMPGGTVTLQAIAVNKYGKASNTFSRTFKFEVKPYPKSAYTTDDTANGVALYTTTYEQFVAKYGDPKSSEAVALDAYQGEAGTRCTYSWGYADFYREKTVDRLVRLYFTGALSGPRSTSIGDLESNVVSAFRDMGQVTSPSGNRGLYSVTNSSGNISSTGYIYADVDGYRVVRYICLTADSHNWQLDYIESASGVVKAIDMIFIP